uniref:DUF295 domain-containing protein n=1 Tax=Steinernema glaseri TaxID=37863 RepID=A0A1I8AV95_9BILA
MKAELLREPEMSTSLLWSGKPSIYITVNIIANLYWKNNEILAFDRRTKRNDCIITRRNPQYNEGLYLMSEGLRITKVDILFESLSVRYTDIFEMKVYSYCRQGELVCFQTEKDGPMKLFHLSTKKIYPAPICAGLEYFDYYGCNFIHKNYLCFTTKNLDFIYKLDLNREGKMLKWPITRSARMNWFQWGDRRECLGSTVYGDFAFIAIYTFSSWI